MCLQFYKKIQNCIKIAKNISKGSWIPSRSFSCWSFSCTVAANKSAHLHRDFMFFSLVFLTVFCWSRGSPLPPLSSGLSLALSVPRIMMVCQMSLVFDDNNKVWRVCLGNFVPPLPPGDFSNLRTILKTWLFPLHDHHAPPPPTPTILRTQHYSQQFTIEADCAGMVGRAEMSSVFSEVGGSLPTLLETIMPAY